VSAPRGPDVKPTRRAGRGSVAVLGAGTGLGAGPRLAIVSLPPAAGSAARPNGRRPRLESASARVRLRRGGPLDWRRPHRRRRPLHL